MKISSISQFFITAHRITDAASRTVRGGCHPAGPAGHARRVSRRARGRLVIIVVLARYMYPTRSSYLLRALRRCRGRGATGDVFAIPRATSGGRDARETEPRAAGAGARARTLTTITGIHALRLPLPLLSQSHWPKLSLEKTPLVLCRPPVKHCPRKCWFGRTSSTCYGGRGYSVACRSRIGQ